MLRWNLSGNANDCLRDATILPRGPFWLVVPQMRRRTLVDEPSRPALPRSIVAWQEIVSIVGLCVKVGQKYRAELPVCVLG